MLYLCMFDTRKVVVLTLIYKFDHLYLTRYNVTNVCNFVFRLNKIYIENVTSVFYFMHCIYMFYKKVGLHRIINRTN